jgi:hypothetical protein
MRCVWLKCKAEKCGIETKIVGWCTASGDGRSRIASLSLYEPRYQCFEAIDGDGRQVSIKLSNAEVELGED